MVNRISTIVFFFLSSFQGFSQETSETPLKWELGVDLKSLFTKTTELSSRTYGLILRRKVSEEGALRFRPSVLYSLNFKPVVKRATAPFILQTNLDFGYEKQKKHKKFIHNYGMDLVMRYESNDYTIGMGINGTDYTFTKMKGKSQMIGISFFTGGKYLITERISLSLETSLGILAQKLWSQEGEVNLDNEYIRTSSISKSSGLFTRFDPLSVIYLSYYF
ncbi:MAG: hypothetical protein ABS46_02940 [Cytophagaceae bacterium SCN 52-12]|nr:MAG: hypothetical protein ABS46_02940 [Cytophagaceae bacterium SCN 52-12]